MSFFNRVREAFSSTADLANTDPHNWRLPSSYSPSKPGGKPTIIPSPKLFANAHIPGEPKAGNIDSLLAYPDISHAAAHVALLECFWNLRRSATSLDVEISQPPPPYEEKSKLHTSAILTKEAAPSRPAIPESQKWDLLINLVVARFGAWWSNIDDILNHTAAYTHHAGTDVAVQLTKHQLPPLDVLLVWYVFMLNHEAYQAACRGNHKLQKLCFPWPAICEVINMETMQLPLPRTAEILFSTLSGQSANIMTYLEHPPAYTDPVASLQIDLAAEVKKHEEWLDKSHSLLWVRSPAIVGSLARALSNYLDFRLYGGGTACSGSAGAMVGGVVKDVEEKWRGMLPFGIDLFWRTHKLFPYQYDLFVQEIVRKEGTRHASSQDQPPQPGPSPELEWCWCWTCERIRDDIPAYTKFSSPEAQKQLFSSISSDQLRQIVDDLGFHEAVESARRRGATLPTRPPTRAEKQAEELEKSRKKELGYLPGLHEYFEVMPDGTRKIRRQKNVLPFGNTSWMFVGGFE